MTRPSAMTPNLARAIARAVLAPGQKKALKLWLRELAARWFAWNLPKLALLYGTDKWGSHWYAKHYGHHFVRFRKRPMVLLEIGIGGYGNTREGGESLRMW